MASNAQRGAYYKARTRKWLDANGFAVADLEIVRYVWTPRGRMPVKRDQLGADLLGVSLSQVVFVQVKGGEQARGNGQFMAAQREFRKYEFPQEITACWIVAWAPGARLPRVITVNMGAGSNGQEKEQAGAREKGRSRKDEQGAEAGAADRGNAVRRSGRVLRGDRGRTRSAGAGAGR